MTDTKTLLKERARKTELKEAKRVQETLLDELEVLRNRMAQFEKARNIKVQTKPIGSVRKGREKAGDRRPGVFVAAASDWHVAERVDPSKVNGLNEYDPQIARDRSERYFQGIVELVRAYTRGTHSIQEIVLWLGGDFLSGYIHKELIESNYMSPTRESAFARELIKRGLEFVRSELPDVAITCATNFGNHGRTTDKTQIGTAGDNSFEQALYRDLAMMCPEVTFHIAEGHHGVVDIFDLRLHLHHGDSVRSQGGIGGIQVPLRRAALAWQKKYKAHVSLVGHFHTYMPSNECIVNGSLVGYGSYSDFLASAQPEPAQQASFVVDYRRGVCLQTPIWCEPLA